MNELLIAAPLSSGRTRMADIVAAYGTDHLVFPDKHYGYLIGFTLSYPRLGAAFYFRFPYRSRYLLIRRCDEKRATLRTIYYDPPFAGRTEKGIVLGRSLLRDGIAAHGEPEMSERISEPNPDSVNVGVILSPLVYANYPALGLTFSVERIGETHLIQVRPYTEHVIVGIEVSSPGRG